MEICNAMRLSSIVRTSLGASRMDELLQMEDFEPLVGKTVRFAGTRFEFPLDKVVSAGECREGMNRKPFILIFRGPKTGEFLPEGLYECEFEKGPTYTIYVNPIHTPAPDRQEYQAVFN
jgi:hypothetical protein